MGRAKRAEVHDLVGAGERWETGRGDGGRLYIAGVRRVAIADFDLGGVVPSDVAHDRARIAAQAPSMYEALLDQVTGAREDGALIEKAGRPHEGHGPGCRCGLCEGLVALALAEGSGRCIVCACTQDDACVDGFGEGCAWVDAARFICSAHPPDVIQRAQRFLAAPHRKEK